MKKRHPNFASLVALFTCAAAFVGCNSPDPGTEKSSITVDGRERTFVFHVPESAPAEGSRMVVISLHGRLGTGVQQEDLTGFSTLADKRGFVAIYPDGIDKSWADGRGTSEAEMQGVDDVAFISALIDHAIEKLGGDPKKVFINGHSNGSVMTNRLACELSAKIAGIGHNAGPIAEKVSMTCSPSRSLSVIGFHGTADEFMPYAGGEVVKGSGGKVLSAKDARAFWASKAGCAMETKTTALPDTATDDGTTVELEESTACKDGAEIQLHTITNGGHTWPGSTDDLGETLVGKLSRDIIASEIMIDFYEKHPMP
jgi:polyhydroxybutyrate depolymerase